MTPMQIIILLAICDNRFSLISSIGESKDCLEFLIKENYLIWEPCSLPIVTQKGLERIKNILEG
jgi:hypothetical protein